MTVQNRLKQVIKSKKLKITEFAEICDIPYRSVQGYLYGESMPGSDAVIKICAQFSVNPTWLLMGKGEMYEREQSKKLITNLELELFFNWLTEWWKNADDKNRIWLEIQMKRSFPEYAEWITQHEKH
ncbi:MAG: hypothetical protein DRQ49_11655 [Gammaproteobacteria bacterium]|nr:MAG: hypothetical protein DRQ49_11655 [Gammaproteobacteria bacterium]RKZ41251.1 MAG: hypothetical protein DRQ41_08435 [Gammaproteobacteria bacterium]RKZ75605.1 MAG: hypothetical protein DRQ57_06935 [Gammaproteobacteria bacterium]